VCCLFLTRTEENFRMWPTFEIYASQTQVN
jgi:hypothetical protein